MTQYVISHKPVPVPTFPDSCLIQVGSGEAFTAVRDNTGDQISEKNPNFCELTALYWIWKNDHTSDIVGINHYRRFFNGLDKPDEIKNILNSYDLIVPEWEPYGCTVWNQYCLSSGFASDLEKVRSILVKNGDQRYVTAFDKVMKSGGLHQYNMMITSKKLFDSYCEWLFPILFELEKDTDLSNYNDYQKRIYGFLSERLLNVWIEANNLKYKIIPVVQPEMTFVDKIKRTLHRMKMRSLYKKSVKKENR